MVNFRALYLNVRPWDLSQRDASEELDQNAVSEKVEIHVIDLLKKRSLGAIYTGHKGITKFPSCFLLFSAVSEGDWLLSGSEDSCARLWYKHYR